MYSEISDFRQNIQFIVNNYPISGIWYDFTAHSCDEHCDVAVDRRKCETKTIPRLLLLIYACKRKQAKDEKEKRMDGLHIASDNNCKYLPCMYVRVRTFDQQLRHNLLSILYLVKMS